MAPRMFELPPMPFAPIHDMLIEAGITVVGLDGANSTISLGSYRCQRGRDSVLIALYVEGDQIVVGLAVVFTNLRWWNFPLVMSRDLLFGAEASKLLEDVESVLFSVGAKPI